LIWRTSRIVRDINHRSVSHLAPKAQATRHRVPHPPYVAHPARHQPLHLAPKAQATRHRTSHQRTSRILRDISHCILRPRRKLRDIEHPTPRRSRILRDINHRTLRPRRKLRDIGHPTSVRRASCATTGIAPCAQGASYRTMAADIRLKDAHK